jgi:NAD(P)-dependent dehydrogenase (short-subunit alcohol dehydrogenase family)
MRTICVSGAASGIARALAEQLRADGHRVIGVDLRDADVVADLSTPGGRTAAVAGVLDACDGRLDGLAALAGVGPQLGAAAQVTVNHFGAVALLEGLRGALALGNAPAALVASSIAATVASFDQAIVDASLAGDEAAAVELSAKIDGGIGYATSKRSLALYVRHNAPAWAADGIRLNALAPGNTHSALTKAALADPQFGPMMEAVPVPRGSWAEPPEIAAAAAWALSPAASFLVGSFFVVDGGTDALVRPDSF